MDESDKKCIHDWKEILVLNSDKQYWKCSKCGKIKYY